MLQSKDAGNSGSNILRSRPRAEVVYSDKSITSARAERRKQRSVKSRVENAIEEAERASLLYDASSVTRVRSAMTRLALGCTDDLRSNLFQRGGKHVPYAEVIEGFDEVFLDSLSGLDERLVTLIRDELETGNRERIGPKSMYRGYYEDGPDKLAAVMSDKPVPRELDLKKFKLAVDRLAGELPSQSIRLYSVDDVVNTLREPGQEHDPESPGLDGTTNSGLPFCKGKWRPNSEMDVKQAKYSQMVLDYITAKAKAQFHQLSKGETVQFSAMVFQRLVSRGMDPLNDEKTKRLVLALDKSEAVLWKTFTPQTQEARRYVKCPGGSIIHSAWCDAPVVDDNMQIVLKGAAADGRNVMSGDVSAFDASVVPELWKRMAHGVSDWFYRGKGFFSALNESDIYNVTVLSPLGVTHPCASSIKSGSGGTNFVDSLYNLVAMYYGEEMGFYKLFNYAVQGDDFIIDGVQLSPELVSRAYKHMGLIVHPEKQTYEEGVLMYLQRLHVLGMRGGFASVYRTLGSTMVYERMSYDSWNPYMEAIQTISKLENPVFHPSFEQLVAYVKSWDKYALGSNLSPEEVIKQAGRLAGDLLASQGRYSLNAGALDRSPKGFGRAATNGVLRGESLPPIGSNERFLRAYGDDRALSSLMYN